MKTNRTLLFGAAITVGVALFVQSCTGVATETDLLDGTELGQDYDSSEDDGTTCETPKGYFTEVLDDVTFYFEGVELESDPTVEKSTMGLGAPPSLAQPNPTNWEYCSSGDLKEVDADTASTHAPTVYAEYTDDNKTSIEITVKANVDTKRSSTALPEIIAYTESDDSDTLIVIVSYSDDLTSSCFQFNLESSLSNVLVYALKDDPKTTRGTVTTVQSHKGW